MKREIRSDYVTVMPEVAEQLRATLAYAEHGKIIDFFQAGAVDPWQQFLFYGAANQALLDYVAQLTTPTLLVHVQPEGLSMEEPTFTPVTGLVDHIMIESTEQLKAGLIDVATVHFTGDMLAYQGSDPSEHEVILLCDYVEQDSPYISECVRLVEEMGAKRVVALPLMVWNPVGVDGSSTVDEVLKRENRPIS